VTGDDGRLPVCAIDKKSVEQLGQVAMGSLCHFAAADLLSDHCKYPHADSQYPCQLFCSETAQQCKRNCTSGGEYVVSIPH